jgi:uncharacterized XkdX family phage protein
MYDFIKQFYDEGLYINDNVKVFVSATWITETEYETITGEAYVT